MARFTVRVELHRANEDDYEALHAAMEGAGFSRRITSERGVTFLLPTAEYNLDKAATLEQVLDLAKEAARTTSKRYAVLVTQSQGRRWDGLQTVE